MWKIIFSYFLVKLVIFNYVVLFIYGNVIIKLEFSYKNDVYENREILDMIDQYNIKKVDVK